MATSLESTYERTCPCGNGTYAVAVSATDWGGSTEQWTMRCDDCRTQYALFDFTQREKDRQWIAHVWVRASDGLALNALDEKIAGATASIEQQARSALLEQWMALPPSVESKKRLWELLTDSGAIEYPSLATFYAQVRRIGLDRYWEQEFSLSNMNRVLAVLDHDDHEIQTAMGQLDHLRNERSEQERRLIADGFA